MGGEWSMPPCSAASIRKPAAFRGFARVRPSNTALTGLWTATMHVRARTQREQRTRPAAQTWSRPPAGRRRAAVPRRLATSHPGSSERILESRYAASRTSAARCLTLSRPPRRRCRWAGRDRRAPRRRPATSRRRCSVVTAPGPRCLVGPAEGTAVEGPRRRLVAPRTRTETGQNPLVRRLRPRWTIAPGRTLSVFSRSESQKHAQGPTVSGLTGPSGRPRSGSDGERPHGTVWSPSCSVANGS